MGDFDGVAEIYQASRHLYPTELRDHLVAVGALSGRSVVVDLGAGTGQLAMLAAGVASSVIAVDPEPEMVEVGRQVTGDHPTIRWVFGADRDLLELIQPPVDLVLIGNAFHHMDRETLLRDLDRLVDASGHVVVCSTSIPVWLQDAPWSAALRDQLSVELGRPVGAGGTPDHDSDMEILGTSAFSEVKRWTLARQQPRSVESIVGEVVSSSSGAIDGTAAERLRSTLAPYVVDGLVTERVITTALLARRPWCEAAITTVDSSKPSTIRGDLPI